MTKPSRFNLVSCKRAEENSSSPEEKPTKNKFIFKNSEPNEENNEEFEKLEIQPFNNTILESALSSDINNQGLEKNLTENYDTNYGSHVIKNYGNAQRRMVGFEDLNSPDLRMKSPKTIIYQNETNIDENYVEEVIKKHRHTCSRRLNDSKQEKPEEKEKKYMKAMGKSIVAFNYKSQISSNPLNKLNAIDTHVSSEEENKIAGQFSPGNKILLIPIPKCFRMGSMQEINFSNSLKKISNMQTNDLSNNLSTNNLLPNNLLPNNLLTNNLSPIDLSTNNEGNHEEIINPIGTFIEKNPEIKKEVPNRIGDQLFEDLIIIGVDKCEINKLNPKDIETHKSFTVLPKILYSFHSENESPDLVFVFLQFY